MRLFFQQDISDLLSAHHYVTEVTDDGFDAGIKVKEFMPDLIILDLLMPGIDGFEVCRRIKNDITKSHIEAGKKGDNLHTRITDTGVGISPDDFEKIFEELFQVK